MLLHLLANLYQPIMLLGPSGAGKTTLLRQIQAKAHDSWKVCYISATPNSSFERILDEMTQVLRKSGQRVSTDAAESWLEEQLTALSRVEQTLVLLLDDAGLLMPGLLAVLGRFARQHPALRLAFALRPEDLRVKTATDAWAVTGSHIVHLPSPAESEPGEPSVRPLHRPPGQASSNIVRSVAVAGIVAAVLTIAAVALLLWRDDNQSRSSAESAKAPVASPTAPSDASGVKSEPPQVVPPANNVESTREAAPSVLQPEGKAATNRTAELDSTVPSPPAGGTAEAEGSTRQAETGAATRPPVAEASQAAAAELQSPVHSEASGQAARGGAVAAQPTAEEAKRSSDHNTAAVQEPRRGGETHAEMGEQNPQQPSAANMGRNLVEGVKGADWFMQQDPNAYTLQVVALAQLEALARFIERIPSRDQLATFRSRKGSGALYQLFYGIYPSLAAAREMIEGWPSALGRPYPRQLKSIQQEIRRVSSRKTDATIPSR